MKLFFAPASPFVRKVLVVAHELGIESRIERVTVNPWQADAQLTAANPVGKIPALIEDDGTTLYDSSVICEYLDSRYGGNRLLPQTGAQRWQTLRLQALGNGILEAAVLWRMESLRAEAERSSSWIELQRSAVMRGLDALESEAREWDEGFDLGRITAACTLGYLDFRFATEPWRDTHPLLAKWYQANSARTSLQQTIPQG